MSNTGNFGNNVARLNYARVAAFDTTGWRTGWAIDGMEHDGTWPGLASALSTSEAFHIDQIWLCAKLAASLAWDDEIAAVRMAGWKVYGYDTKDGGAFVSRGWLSCMRRGTNDAPIIIATPSLTPGHPFGAVDDAMILSCALDTYQDSMGMSLASSPGATAIKLLRTLHSGKTAIKLSMSYQVPEKMQPADSDLIWLRPQPWPAAALAALAEPDGWYIHVYDKNAAYLGACGSLSYGFGEPIVVHAGDDPSGHLDPVGAYLPGYYRVVAIASSRAQDERWARIVAPPWKPTPADHTWVTAPTMQYLRELAAPVHVAQAVVWLEHHRYLASWQARMRDARYAIIQDLAQDSLADGAILFPSDTLALAAIKQTYTQFFGWLNGHWLGEGDELNRPDWRHTVIAESRVRMERQIQRIAEPGARQPAINIPIGARVDALYILSQRTKASHCADDCDLHIGRTLRDWKITADAVPLSALVPAFDTWLDLTGAPTIHKLDVLVRGYVADRSRREGRTA